MRKELLNKANLAWLLLSVVSFIVLTILMKVGIIGSYYSITLYNIFINIILAVSLNLVIGVCGQFSLGSASSKESLTPTTAVTVLPSPPFSEDDLP